MPRCNAPPRPPRARAIIEAEAAILATHAAIPMLHERVIQGEAAGVADAVRDPRERELVGIRTHIRAEWWRTRPLWRGGGQGLRPSCLRCAIGGEISLIHIRGAFSHALLRRPTVGEWRANSQYGAAVEKARPDAATLAAARSALDALPAVPAYARVDGCLSPERGFTVTEVELIEPALFLHLWPGKAGRIAELLDPGPDWLASRVSSRPPSA